jgi:phenylpropionate dioxygenase-like ring-hydroxylating dioxygenase large terminal subunit
MSVNPVGTPLHKFPEPELGTAIIPKERYTSPEFAALEWERMWTRTWLLAGPVSDLEKVGDYFTFEIGRESIIVSRSAPERIDAFYNVCQHRASQVVVQRGCGHARSFVCPYHLWTYDLSGRLRGLPDREDFPQGIPEDTRLVPLRVETWGGWVFVNMDPQARPLAEYLGAVADHLAPYDFGRNYALALDYSFEWDCNWKVGVDAFNEVYHVQGIHPELLPFTDDVDCPIDLLGKHSRFLFKVGVPSPRWSDRRAQAAGYRDRNALSREMRELLGHYRMDPAPFENDAHAVRPALIARSRELGRAAGWDLSALNDEQLWIDVHYTLFPNITFNISAGHFWLFRHRPQPGDPGRMIWDFQEYRRIAPGGERPPRPEHVHARWGEGHEKKLHLALFQDGEAAPPQQRGLESRGFRGLQLARQERRIRHFHAILDEYLASANTEARS